MSPRWDKGSLKGHMLRTLNVSVTKVKLIALSLLFFSSFFRSLKVSGFMFFFSGKRTVWVRGCGTVGLTRLKNHIHMPCELSCTSRPTSWQLAGVYDEWASSGGTGATEVSPVLP